MTPTLDNAAAALRDPDALSAEQCKAFVQLLSPHKWELERQVAAFYNPEAATDRWRDRLALGADVGELRREYDDLVAERDRACAQYAAFFNLERECRAREAAATIPDARKALDKAADKVTRARAALAEACAELDRRYNAATNAHHLANTAIDPANAQLADKVVETADAAAFEPSGPLYYRADKRQHMIYQELRAQHFEPIPVVT